MKAIYQKIIIVLSILLFKILIWYIFQNQAIDLSNLICENLGIVTKGKQDFFNGIPKLIVLIKVSILIIDVLLDLVILLSLRFIFRDFILKRFIYNYLIVSFIILLLVLLLF